MGRLNRFLRMHELENTETVIYTQYGPIKNGRIKNQGSDFEKK